MGCDMTVIVEKKIGGEWWRVDNVKVFADRDYGLFGWLVGVRNYSEVAPLSQVRGLPDDVDDDVAERVAEDPDAHSASWIAVSELASVDYDQAVVDKRKYDDGSEDDGHHHCSLREFLGPHYFKDLDLLQRAQADRLVFWFDG